MGLDAKQSGAAEARRWAKTLQEVSEFKAEFGVLPGGSYRTPREHSLRQWVRGQRIKANAGELSQDRIAALNHVDPDWRANGTRLPWEDNLAAAMIDYQRLGRIPDNDYVSGVWLQQQRSRMSAGKIDAGQIASLDEGLPGWRNLDRVNWFERVPVVQKYVEKAGKIPTSRTADPEAVQHYTWITWQRKKLRAGKLDAEQVALLDKAVPGWRGRNNATAPKQFPGPGLLAVDDLQDDGIDPVQFAFVDGRGSAAAFVEVVDLLAHRVQLVQADVEQLILGHGNGCIHNFLTVRIDEANGALRGSW